MSPRHPLPPRREHPDCFACSEHHPFGLKLNFRPFFDTALPHQGVLTDFWTHEHWQGYPQQLHGGIISTLLDAAMTHCLFELGIQAVTARLQVRFRSAVPLHQTVQVLAWHIQQRGKLHRLHAELRLQDQCLASAEADFMATPGP